MDSKFVSDAKFVIDTNPSSDAKFVIDTNPTSDERSKFKRKLYETDKSYEHYTKKQRFNENGSFKSHHYKQEDKNSEDVGHDSGISAAIVYYENILKDLKKGLDNEMKDEIIANVLKESEGKEVELSCHGITSHCLEILLNGCKDTSIILRFMSAFEENKIPVFTSANASHVTELLIHNAVKALQNWSLAINSEESKEKSLVTQCMHWLEVFGNFALENLDDCLSSQYSCHVVCTLIGALAGDLGGNKELMSKNLKNHKKEFHSQFSEMNVPKKVQEQDVIVLELIPKSFSDVLKSFYKALVKLENLTDYINDSSSATVIEAMLFALKKRHPKSCKKMITKIAKKIFLQRNQDDVPLALFNKNASYVFDEMFKLADENLQLALWNEHLSNHIGKLVIDAVGNFVMQRVYDAIKSKTLFEIVCKCTWECFDKILEFQNFGIFVSISSACNRLGAQQALFMENIMKCLQCFEPIERQDLIIPLLLGFQKYDHYMTKKYKSDIKICLQGSLVVQAILKYQKPLKAVKSIQNMSPAEIEFLAGHIQGCHALNAFFGSITVGDKNKEKLLHYLQPVLVSMACDRNKSLTLSRIWTLLSLKLKEIVARQLAQQQSTLKNTKSGYAVFQKFGIPRFRKLDEWKQMQSNISCNKRPQKY